jgi:hypothetical protein
VLRIAMTLKMITGTASCHEQMVNAGIVRIIESLRKSLSDISCHDVICALCNMASSKACRRYLVDQGAAELIVRLSRLTSTEDTHQQCTLALGYLSEITRLNDGIVKSFLSLHGEGDHDHEDDHDHHGEGEGSDEDEAPAGLDNLRALHVTTASIRPGSRPTSGTSTPITPDLGMDAKWSSKRFSQGPSGLSTLKRATQSVLQSLRQKKSFRAPIMPNSRQFTVAKLIDKDHTSYADSVDGGILDEEERNLLITDYGDYEFKFIQYEASFEEGGMTNHFKVDLPLPSISATSFADPVNRLEDLPKFAVGEDSLPKVTDLVTDFKSLSLMQNTRGDGMESERNDDDQDDDDDDGDNDGSASPAASSKYNSKSYRALIGSIALEDNTDVDMDDMPSLESLGFDPHSLFHKHDKRKGGASRNNSVSISALSISSSRSNSISTSSARHGSLSVHKLGSVQQRSNSLARLSGLNSSSSFTNKRRLTNRDRSFGSLEDIVESSLTGLSLTNIPEASGKGEDSSRVSPPDGSNKRQGQSTSLKGKSGKNSSSKMTVTGYGSGSDGGLTARSSGAPTPLTGRTPRDLNPLVHGHRTSNPFSNSNGHHRDSNPLAKGHRDSNPLSHGQHGHRDSNPLSHGQHGHRDSNPLSHGQHGHRDSNPLSHGQHGHRDSNPLSHGQHGHRDSNVHEAHRNSNLLGQGHVKGQNHDDINRRDPHLVAGPGVGGGSHHISSGHHGAHDHSSKQDVNKKPRRKGKGKGSRSGSFTGVGIVVNIGDSTPDSSTKLVVFNPLGELDIDDDDADGDED